MIRDAALAMYIANAIAALNVLSREMGDRDDISDTTRGRVTMTIGSLRDVAHMLWGGQN